MPLVILPLGVVFSEGKGRLIVNGPYCNLFMKQLPFQYERLWDILGFTKGGYFMSNWDLKSGYYHVLLHPNYWKYLGVRIGNTVLRLNVVFFGYAQTCYIFTKTMQEPCYELKAAGIPVSNYVRDGFTAAETKLACLWQAIWAVLLQAALGAHHGLAKCQIEPILLIKWLGFMVDSQNEKFEVAASKLEKLKDSPRAGLAKRTVSARDLAQIAGRITPSAQQFPPPLSTTEPSFRPSNRAPAGTCCSQTPSRSNKPSNSSWTTSTTLTGNSGSQSL